MISAFISGVCIRIYTIKKEESKLLFQEIKEYIPQFEKFSGLPRKIFLLKLQCDTPLVYEFENKNYLILYFKTTDCLTCLEEMKNIVDSLKKLKFLNTLIVTDHPVLEEIKYFMYKLGIEEIIWDINNSLFGSRVEKTPCYVFIKKNKIKRIGIVAPLKREGEEIFGLFAHKLKRSLK